MHEESPDKSSLAASVGCSLVVLGAISAAVGVAALVGVGYPIELEFFGIELHHRDGRLLWVAGSLVAVVVGVVLFRKRPGA